MRFLAPLFLAFTLPACIADSDKGDESDLPDLDAKDDSFRKPTDHGPLEFGVPVTSALTDAERFHTWTFELSGDADLELVTSYAIRGQRRTDTVLYLYKEGPTGWGSYIARNDDYGTTTYSRIARSLGAGRYRALVKGYADTTRGKFKLTVGCTGVGCEPAVVAGACLFGSTYGDLEGNPALETINRNVITAASLESLSAIDQERLMLAVRESSHDDVTTPLEAIGRVDQGEVNVTWFHEPAAQRAFVAFEYGAGDNSYGAIFDKGTGAMAASIHDGDLDDCTHVAETCLLPDDYSALRSDPQFTLQESRAITQASQLVGLEAEQVLAAMTHAYEDITTLEQGLAQVDDNVVHLRTYFYGGTNADLTIVEFGMGDTSLGTIYFYNSMVVAGVIDDLFIGACALFAAPGDHMAAAGESCRANADCVTGAACRGVFAGAGVCATIAEPPGEGAECAADGECGAGLVCAGATRGYGMCRPAWMRGSFEDAATSSIPDGGVLVRRTSVRGLATVDTDVLVRATLAHPRASQLRVTLANPTGTELVVHDGAAADDGHDVAIDTALHFSGDESVNGEWTLRVTDRATGHTGTLRGWTLTVTSRWD